jgi:hypothetical protein
VTIQQDKNFRLFLFRESASREALKLDFRFLRRFGQFSPLNLVVEPLKELQQDLESFSHLSPFYNKTREETKIASFSHKSDLVSLTKLDKILPVQFEPGIAFFDFGKRVPFYLFHRF